MKSVTAEIAIIEYKCPYCENQIILSTEDFTSDTITTTCICCKNDVIVHSPEEMKIKE